MAWILAADGKTLQWTGPGPAPYVPPGDQNALRAQIKAAGGAPQAGPSSQQFGVVSPSPGAAPIPLTQYQQQQATLSNVAQKYGSSTPQQTGGGGVGDLAAILAQRGLAQQYNSGPNLQAIYGTTDINSIKGWTLAPDGRTLQWTGPGPAPYVPWDQQNALRQQIATSGGTPQASPAGSRYGGFVPAPGGVPVFIDPLTGLPLAAPPTGNDEQRNVLSTGGVWGGLSPQAQQTFNAVIGPYEAEILKQKPGDPYASRVVNALGGTGRGGAGYDAGGLGGFAGQFGNSSGQAGAGAGGGGGQNLISPQFGATGQTIDYALMSDALSGFNLPSRIPRSEPGNPTVFNPFVGHERSAADYPLSPNTSDLLHEGNLFGPQALDPSRQQLALLGSQYIQGVPYGYGAQAAMQQGSPGFDAAALLPFGSQAYAPLAPAGFGSIVSSDGSTNSYQQLPGGQTPAAQQPQQQAAQPGGVGPNFDWNAAYQQYVGQQNASGAATGAQAQPMTQQQFQALYAPKTSSPDNFGGQFGGPVIQRGATPGYTGQGALAYNEAGLLTNPQALQLPGGNNAPGAGGLGAGLGTGPGAVNAFMGAPGFGGNSPTGAPNPWVAQPSSTLGGASK